MVVADLSVKMRTLGWTLNQYDWCPHMKGKFGHKDIRNRENPMGRWGLRPASQGTPNTASEQPKARRERRSRALPPPSEGTSPAGPCGTQDIQNREPTRFCCFSHPVCGTLLQQAEQTNTLSHAAQRVSSAMAERSPRLPRPNPGALDVPPVGQAHVQGPCAARPAASLLGSGADHSFRCVSGPPWGLLLPPTPPRPSPSLAFLHNGAPSGKLLTAYRDSLGEPQPRPAGQRGWAHPRAQLPGGRRTSGRRPRPFRGSAPGTHLRARSSPQSASARPAIRARSRVLGPLGALKPAPQLALCPCPIPSPPAAVHRADPKSAPSSPTSSPAPTSRKPDPEALTRLRHWSVVLLRVEASFQCVAKA